MMSYTYDYYVVGLSVLIAIAASYTALDLAGRVSAASGYARLAWLLTGSLAMGVGIWSMHFVGMLALELPVAVGYEAGLVLLSTLVAMGASMCALHVASRAAMNKAAHLTAALFMGPAIAGMHYLGMAALHGNMFVTYDRSLVLLSITIAVGASWAALWLVRRFRAEQTRLGELAKAGSAVIMGVAIAGMHYTAMAAAHFHSAAPHATVIRERVAGGSGLSVTVAILTLAVMSIALGASAIHRNIASRLLNATRTSEEVVRSHEAFLRQIIDVNPSLVFVKDWDGRFLLANKALADVYGTTVDGLVGKTDSDFNSQEEEVRRFLEDDRHVMTGQVPKRISEEAVTSANGLTRWYQTVKMPLTGTDNPIPQVLGVATDITDRKLLEDQLRHAQKIEALGQLTGGIAHDLNNVLTVILANTGLIAPHIEHSHTDVQRDFHDLQAAASRGADMVRKLLAFSRRETLRIQPMVVDEFFKELLSTVRRLLPATIEVRLHCEPHLPHISADDGALQQMLLNLATNARDAMPNGGTIAIDVGTKTIDNEWCVTNGWGCPGKFVCITLSDTGCGMSAETKEKIFEPFFTTKAPGEGTGLGLPMVYGLVRQHEGFIGVYSEPGQGTTVRLYFPTTADRVLDASASAACPMRGGNETILIADDEESIRRSTTRVLERHGYQVITACTGEEALEIINARGKDIDLVISDVVMPKMGGKELYSALANGGFEIPFLFTSGYAAREVRESVSLDPSVPFLHKPWAMSDLLQKVREVVDKAPTPVD